MRRDEREMTQLVDRTSVIPEVVSSAMEELVLTLKIYFVEELFNAILTASNNITRAHKSSL